MDCGVFDIVGGCGCDCSGNSRFWLSMEEYYKMFLKYFPSKTVKTNRFENRTTLCLFISKKYRY